jgi:hypothetical protein
MPGSVLRVLVAVLLLTPWTPPAAAQIAEAPETLQLTCADMESFLRTAKIMGRRKDLPVGVTVPSRITLDDGRIRHDAAVQNVDVKKATFDGVMGTELNFRDAWQFNVAGYELAKLLGLNMVPPYVDRAVSGYASSVSWWVDDAMMERDRIRKKIPAPDPARWNQQMYAARVFHELIGDSDPNATNILITRDWRVWLIDFTRAFRQTRTLRRPEGLRQVDRQLLARLREVTDDQLQQVLGPWLIRPEIQGLLSRRDRIVELFDEQVAARGESAVLYEFERTREPCGTGLEARTPREPSGQASP